MNVFFALKGSKLFIIISFSLVSVSSDYIGYLAAFDSLISFPNDNFFYVSIIVCVFGS